MYFQYTMTIPKNTPVSAPANFRLSMANGVLNKVEVEIPQGAAGLAGVQVWDRGRIIIPFNNPNEWLTGNDRLFQIDNFNYLHTLPWALTLTGFNLDDTYSHNIVFGFYIDTAYNSQSSGGF